MRRCWHEVSLIQSLYFSPFSKTTWTGFDNVNYSQNICHNTSVLTTADHNKCTLSMVDNKKGKTYNSIVPCVWRTNSPSQYWKHQDRTQELFLVNLQACRAAWPFTLVHRRLTLRPSLFQVSFSELADVVDNFHSPKRIPRLCSFSRTNTVVMPVPLSTTSVTVSFSLANVFRNITHNKDLICSTHRRYYWVSPSSSDILILVTMAVVLQLFMSNHDQTTWDFFTISCAQAG